ncbi:cyclase family protein [Paroceanicella profunda]|uniref:Cyclase family protein n=1 Tax=Paroceanicella profunda TaxID=2579971 RepID=A0A5B8G0N3_9RHOB|nr:cyclase family protein [Paroceanicella profunda]QDL92679.1 cyclase family protein [Paroceanicella profunda]QDL92684.1 cyclase family protein [Paroceanicella profunda]
MTGVLGDLALALASGAVEVVDLTHALTPDFPVIVLPPEFGQCAPFRIEEVSRYDARGPAWYWNNISMSEHTGTHFDAPAHWVTGRNQPGGTVDAVGPERLVAPVCVLDMSGPSTEDRDFIMTADHVAAWEAEHGAIPPGAWVLMRTDWAKKAGSPAYVGLEADGAHSPGPDASAIEALLARGIIGFGTETVGTDAGQGAHLSPPYPAHSLLHGAGKLGLQCLAGLDRLPPKGAMLIAPPLKIAGGSGSPLRVLALVPKEGS